MCPEIFEDLPKGSKWNRHAQAAVSLDFIISSLMPYFMGIVLTCLIDML